MFTGSAFTQRSPWGWEAVDSGPGECDGWRHLIKCFSIMETQHGVGRLRAVSLLLENLRMRVICEWASSELCGRQYVLELSMSNIEIKNPSLSPHSRACIPVDSNWFLTLSLIVVAFRLHSSLNSGMRIMSTDFTIRVRISNTSRDFFNLQSFQFGHPWFTASIRGDERGGGGQRKQIFISKQWNCTITENSKGFPLLRVWNSCCCFLFNGRRP